MNIPSSQLYPISTLPRKYNEYVKQTEKTDAIYFIKNNKPQVVLVSFKEWERIHREIETIEKKLNKNKSHSNSET
jgi:prevent-host-death family protein